MSEAAKIQIEIDRLNDEIRVLERQAQGSNSQYVLGVVGVLIGLVLIVFLSVWWLGLFFLLAGALAVFTQGAKKRQTEREIAELQEQIERYRKTLVIILDKTKDN